MANTEFRNIYLLGLVLLALFSSCASTKQLKAHKAVLNELAYGDYSPKEKMDGLGKEMVIVIDESLSKPTAVGTYKHAKRFTNQNNRELERIYGDIDAWQSSLSTPQKVFVGAEVATKGYTRRFITLMPKFQKKVENKYDQLVFFSKLMKLFNPFTKKDSKKKT